MRRFPPLVLVTFGLALLSALALVAPGDAGGIRAARAAGGSPAAAGTPSDTTALIEKGAYLARAGDCIACHTPRGAAPFSGGLPMATPFGTMYTPNITPDERYGIGKWSVDDFWRAMHTGHAKGGVLLYPGFPFTSYTKVTREDSDAIYAYLRSVPPVATPNRPQALRFPFNNRNLLIGWRALFFREGEYRPDPAHDAQWNRGAYLVEGLGHCAMCHTSTNIAGGPVKSAPFSGGLIPLQNWYAPSLTSSEGGLGDWDAADIAALLKTGVSKRGAVYGPMADVVYHSLQYLSDADVQAMAVYLKTLPQKSEAPQPLQLETSEAFGGRLREQGERIYRDSCAKCHAENGLGMPPDYPPLANNQSIQMHSAVNPIRMVLNGGYPPSTGGNPRPYGMPPFGQSLSNDQVAAVVSYIRSAWGNKGAPISPQQVAELRSAPAD